MRKFAYILVLIAMNACNSESQDLFLSGKIVVRLLDSTDGKCYRYSNKHKVEFILPDTKEKDYSGLSWLNRKDILIGVESNNSQSRKTTHSNLVLLDTLGNILERIIETKEGQYIGLASIHH
jgi:hypothetical protein